MKAKKHCRTPSRISPAQVAVIVTPNSMVLPRKASSAGARGIERERSSDSRCRYENGHLTERPPKKTKITGALGGVDSPYSALT